MFRRLKQLVHFAPFVSLLPILGFSSCAAKVSAVETTVPFWPICFAAFVLPAGAPLSSSSGYTAGQDSTRRRQASGCGGQAGAGETQQAVADSIGWSRSAIADYASLRKVCSGAWDVVAGFARNGVSQADDTATEFVATATFTEGLLRSILPLTADQQVELVRRLARGKCQKGRAGFNGWNA